eukprot:4532831-Amphidinium_carterae.1
MSSEVSQLRCYDSADTMATERGCTNSTTSHERDCQPRRYGFRFQGRQVCDEENTYRAVRRRHGNAKHGCSNSGNYPNPLE